MTKRLHGLIDYTANIFGFVRDHSVPSIQVYLVPPRTYEDLVELILPKQLRAKSADLAVRSFAATSSLVQVDPRFIHRSPHWTLFSRSRSFNPTNYRTHHFWREMTLVPTQQG